MLLKKHVFEVYHMIAHDMTYVILFINTELGNATNINRAENCKINQTSTIYESKLLCNHLSFLKKVRGNSRYLKFDRTQMILAKFIVSVK